MSFKFNIFNLQTFLFTFLIILKKKGVECKLGGEAHDDPI